jgi:hypothetical protein
VSTSRSFVVVVGRKVLFVFFFVVVVAVAI